jgi:hypothetical protein
MVSYNSAQHYNINVSLMKKETKLLIAACVLIGLVSTALYINTFGFGLWKNHTKWAEMGNFFGGILGPFFSLIGLSSRVSCHN